jgi:hypothetical protein
MRDTVSMKNLFDEPGVLDVVIGRGCLTAHEATHLAPGAYVRVSDRECGDDAYLFFNSHLIGTGEVCVIDGLLAVRVRKITWNPSPIPFAGEAEELFGVLESRIRLASVPFTMNDLSGIGPYSMIALGKKLTADRIAELTVAGVPVAVGTVGFFGGDGRWTIRIDEAYGR